MLSLLSAWLIPNPIAAVIEVINDSRWGRDLISNPITPVIKNTVGSTEVIRGVIEVVWTIDPIVGTVIKVIGAIDLIVRRVVPVIDRLRHGRLTKQKT